MSKPLSERDKERLDRAEARKFAYLELRERERTKKVYAFCGVMVAGFICATVGVISYSWSKLDWRVQIILVLSGIIPTLFMYLMWRRIMGLVRSVAQKSREFLDDDDKDDKQGSS